MPRDLEGEAESWCDVERDACVAAEGRDGMVVGSCEGASGKAGTQEDVERAYERVWKKRGRLLSEKGGRNCLRWFREDSFRGLAQYRIARAGFLTIVRSALIVCRKRSSGL
jgi:hypothetical protein